jgi:hypothetical protein
MTTDSASSNCAVVVAGGSGSSGSGQSTTRRGISATETNYPTARPQDGRQRTRVYIYTAISRLHVTPSSYSGCFTASRCHSTTMTMMIVIRPGPEKAGDTSPRMGRVSGADAAHRSFVSRSRGDRYNASRVRVKPGRRTRPSRDVGRCGGHLISAVRTRRPGR